MCKGPGDGSTGPSGGWEEDQSGAAESGGAENGLMEGSARLRSWGQGSYGQLLSKLQHGQADLSDKIFLAAAGVGVRGGWMAAG